jgi:hypothetical protein
MKAEASDDARQKPVMPDGSPSDRPLARNVDELLEVYVLNVNFRRAVICQSHGSLKRRNTKKKPLPERTGSGF